MGLLEYARHQVTIGLVVIHHEQRGGREVIEVHRSARLGMIAHGQPSGDGDIRKAQVEGRALAHFALDGQAAAHQLGEALDNRQPDAGAFLFRRSAGVRLDKWLKDLLQFLGRDSDARCPPPQSTASRCGRAAWLSQETRVLTQPRSVNLMALPSKFTSTWRSRRRSSNKARGRSGASSN